jgi:hypothetical protein
MSKREPKYRLATIDCETDPFAVYRTIMPFAWGLWDGEIYVDFIGDDCTQKLIEYLQAYETPLQICAHNGGKFDFMFLREFIRGKILLQNSRVVSALLGKHKLSDSYAMVPVGLGKLGKKLDIEIWKMERQHRQKYMPLIREYLKQDCVGLYEVVQAFQSDNGTKAVTMASAAFKKCLKMVPAFADYKTTTQMTIREDEYFRNYYYGGRVQVFKDGIIQDNIKMHDANSMYPFVMCQYQHPATNISGMIAQRDIDERTDFARIRAYSNGALPWRAKDGPLKNTGLHFPCCEGEFYATGHEIRAGLKHGRLKIISVLEASYCREKTDFKPFIEPIYAARLEAKARGDILNTTLLKLVMNGAYGRFAINPREFTEDIIVQADELPNLPITINEDTGLMQMEQDGLLYVCTKFDLQFGIYHFTHKMDPEKSRSWANVAIAASITGASRAYLFETLCRSENPYYCDTDSVACRALGAHADPTQLGAWKEEAHGDLMAVGGKKIYALFDNRKCVKLASKGAKLTPSQVFAIARGRTWRHDNLAPAMSLTGKMEYVSRHLRKTGQAFVHPFPEPLTRREINGGLEKWAS